MKNVLRKISIASIDKERLITRHSIDQDTVEEYAELMKVEDGSPFCKFPAPVVFEDPTGILILANGHHRIRAAELAGLTELDCDVRIGSYQEALEFAAGANIGNGLRLTSNDKRRAVELLLEHECFYKKSDREIARITGSTHPFVAKIRQEYLAKHETPEIDNPNISPITDDQSIPFVEPRHTTDSTADEIATPTDLAKILANPIEGEKYVESQKTSVTGQTYNFKMVVMEAKQPNRDLPMALKGYLGDVQDGTLLAVVTTVQGLGDLLLTGMESLKPFQFHHLCAAVDKTPFKKGQQGIVNHWNPILVLRKGMSASIPNKVVSDVFEQQRKFNQTAAELQKWFSGETKVLMGGEKTAGEVLS